VADLNEDFSPEGDEADVQASMQRIRAARDVDVEQGFKEQFEPESKAAQGANPFGKWMMKLPKNIGVGMLDAALNTADFAEDVMPGAHVVKAATDAIAPGMDQAIRQAIVGFRDYLAEGSNTADQITQGIAQFAIPFTGYAKGLSAFQTGISFGQKVLRAGTAEVGANKAFDPHTTRLADLIEVGREAENKFGDALRAVSPDGSLINRYISWMIDREDEGEAAGRFKTDVDSLVGSAAIGGLFTVAGKSFRALRNLREAPKPVQTANLPFDSELAVPEQLSTRTYETATGALQQRALLSPGQPMKMADLVDDLDSMTSADSPYRELVNKLKKQKLEGSVSLLSEDDYIVRTKSKGSVGKYNQFASRDKDEVLLNLGKIGKSDRRGELPGYAAIHELVHAGTMRSMTDDPKLLARIEEIKDDTLFKVLGTKGEKEAKRYGFTDPYEFVAEAFSNLRFQNLLKEAGTWKEFVSTMGKVFGLTGVSLAAFENVVALPKEGSDA
jgi:hypothetical protein